MLDGEYSDKMRTHLVPFLFNQHYRCPRHQGCRLQKRLPGLNTDKHRYRTDRRQRTSVAYIRERQGLKEVVDGTSKCRCVIKMAITNKGQAAERPAAGIPALGSLDPCWTQLRRKFFPGHLEQKFPLSHENQLGYATCELCFACFLTH